MSMEIISIGTKDYLINLQIIKDFLKLSAFDLQMEVLKQLDILEKKLNKSDLKYSDFKSVLLPIKKTNKKRDYIFVFDTLKIKNYSYGIEVFKNLIPCFTKKGKHNVLSGDLLNLTNNKDIQPILDLMFKALNRPIINELQYTNRFYLVYITNLSKTEIENIICKLNNTEYFVGACDMTFTSLFKTYVSHCIYTTFIKLEKYIIMGHEPDIEENSNRNMCGFSFEENGYQIISIQGNYFSQFLSYAIDSDLILDSKEQKKYLKLLSNVITSKEKSLDEFQIEIEPKKIIYLEKNKKIISRLKIKENDLDKLLLEKIKSANIYNISFDYKEEFGKVKFNIFFDHNLDKEPKRIQCALEYDQSKNILRVITMY